MLTFHRFLPFYVKNPENKPSKGSFAAGLVFLLYHFLTKPAASAVFCLKSQEYIFFYVFGKKYYY